METRLGWRGNDLVSRTVRTARSPSSYFSRVSFPSPSREADSTRHMHASILFINKMTRDLRIGSEYLLGRCLYFTISR